ncbi:MAG: hypothetical protein M3273_07365, partial [Actinomycetota bacterium]|nr:hypothetical protein [Actinomycetota bacterium]
MDSVPDRYRRTLVRGALVYRWVALAWMSALTASRSSELDDQVVAWASVGAVALWTLRLTTQGRRCSRADLGIDLALSAWLALASGLVVPERDILSEPLFASGYPLSTVFLWGIELGPRAGAAAGGLLAAAVVAARPLNDVPLDALPASEVQSLAGSTVNYLVAGVAVGLVARLLSESAHAVETANERLVRERERAARLAERESLARQIHDYVLQALALVHKRGRELAKGGTVPGPEVERLAEVAGRQEAELRALVLRQPEDHPAGTAS